MLSVCVCHRPRCRGGGLFPGRNFPSHRRKKREKKNIKTKSTETCYSLLMYHIFRKKEKKEEEDIVQDGSLAFCWDH